MEQEIAGVPELVQECRQLLKEKQTTVDKIRDLRF